MGNFGTELQTGQNAFLGKVIVSIITMFHLLHIYKLTHHQHRFCKNMWIVFFLIYHQIAWL